MTISPEIAAAVISGLVMIAVALAQGWVRNRRKILRDLQIAQDDIAFLLEVERLHVESESGFCMGKNLGREWARRNGYAWSGRFTPGRVRGRVSNEKADRSE